MEAKPPEVEPKGWGDNVFRVTPIDLQQREWEKNKDEFVNLESWHFV
jgi:hypothetical protein